MRGVAKYLAVALLLLVVCGESSAQKLKERRLVRQGNEYFDESNIKKSIESYQEALKHAPNSFEAKFNLASALYRDERYEASEKGLQALLNDKSLLDSERGDVAYNLGNVQFKQKKYKEALDSYRKAMRYNPNDEDAKFNYALTKLKLQQQEQQQDQQQNQQNQQDNQGNNDKQQQQNPQNNKDKQEKQNEDKQNDKNQDEQPQNQNGDEDKQQGGQRPKGGMSPEQQEALLQAVQAEEDKTQDKLKEKKGVLLIHGGKNW